MKLFFNLVMLLFVFNSFLFAQGKVYEGPDDPAGDKAAEREGYMTGNRVFLYFQNTTELSKWVANVGPPLWSRWPNNNDGQRMLDGIGLLVGAQVFIRPDGTPETDSTQIKIRTDLDTLHFLQTSYREEMDTDPTGAVEWGLYPVFGYFNEANEYPAMSNIEGSWPTSGWPSTGSSTKWPGEWNGRFGKGVIYADLETYFVANDAQDQEYLGFEDQVKYYPRDGVFIEDDNTLQPGKPWGGIGIRVSQRGFQWNNPQARDAIFWEYSIANISDYDLPKVAFGYWVDNGIGGESDDEVGFFDRQLDMAYSWDNDGVGRAGVATGTMGFAYLESPGIPYDNRDNDEDGLIDEQRDNLATSIVGPTDGIADIDKFLEAYNLELEDLQDHWDADEDQDWQDGVDANNNNAYAFYDAASGEWVAESGDTPNDDVGTDGIGPFELNYDGPDANMTEGNHRPDYDPEFGSEPNFATTDVTESDMVGLTSFRLFPVPSHSFDFRWFRGDESMWELIGQDSTLEFLGNISNLIETFASGPFPLFQGREERISMSELHAFDDLNGLQSDEHSAPALFEQKRIVQVIYESDYRFAKPPLMPTLTATPGDGRVILTWNDIADTKTRDAFVGNINDFEGYKLYRASDKRFSDSEVITDGFGTPFIKKPIFQCDLKDGIIGFTDFGLVNGASYNLGFDTGIVHHFIDSTVSNGRTYYYALVAYDFGAPDIGPGIAPSENTIIVDLDEQESIRSIGPNIAVVIPRPAATGYEPPSINETESNQISIGVVEPEILSNNALKYDHTYKVKFGIDTLDIPKDGDELIYDGNYLIYTPNSFYVYDVTMGNKLVYSETPENFAFSNIKYVEDIIRGDANNDTIRYTTLFSENGFSTDVFDGLRLTINPGIEFAEYDYSNSGWLTGSSPIIISPAASDKNYFPWDYDLVFTNDDSAYVGVSKRRNVVDEKGVKVLKGDLLFNQHFNFYVLNKSFLDSSGQYEKLDIVVHDQNGNKEFDILEDRVLVAPLTKENNLSVSSGVAFAFDFKSALDSTQLPKANDVYRVTHRRPFWKDDSITFSIMPEGDQNLDIISSSMDKIRVVPNPYVMTNSMEEAVANSFLNQRRRLMFFNIPAECTIKIFTVSGLLVDKIDVENGVDNGIVHWDLLTDEGLEVAAGIYIYHIKAKLTGDTKLGKFAIIK
ncbi:MAG: hypothetical protein D8M58_07305 [Calditrichaeota bacterium]|nr:MAG: hypothetical protein DWQ03_19185 [Calditrichota bacterium]MBL1205187.1 hypothetical protein [Calditrichota bacterium]NOG45017.1 hypothetical protein [Calditrichota bacterium]